MLFEVDPIRRLSRRVEGEVHPRERLVTVRINNAAVTVPTKKIFADQGDTRR